MLSSMKLKKAVRPVGKCSDKIGELRYCHHLLGEAVRVEFH